MSWEMCNIIINSDSTGCFYPGDVVTGTIVVKFTQKQKIEHFDLYVSGIRKASWTRPRPTIPYIRIYSETTRVLSIHNDIFTELQGKSVSPGIYTQPFHFTLPPDSPPTFMSSIAKIFYVIKVQCKAAYKFKKEISVSFNVSINLDLNHLETFLMPHFVEMHKFFWDSGKLTLQLQTFTGFAPNQTISFEAIISNKNRVKIGKLIILLIQQIEYNVTSGYLNKKKEIQKVQYIKFNNEETETCSFDMVVPQTMPSCSFPMIKIEYNLLWYLVIPLRKNETASRVGVSISFYVIQEFAGDDFDGTCNACSVN